MFFDFLISYITTVVMSTPAKKYVYYSNLPLCVNLTDKNGKTIWQGRTKNNKPDIIYKDPYLQNYDNHYRLKAKDHVELAWLTVDLSGHYDVCRSFDRKRDVGVYYKGQSLTPCYYDYRNDSYYEDYEDDGYEEEDNHDEEDDYEDEEDNHDYEEEDEEEYDEEEDEEDEEEYDEEDEEDEEEYDEEDEEEYDDEDEDYDFIQHPDVKRLCRCMAIFKQNQRILVLHMSGHINLTQITGLPKKFRYDSKVHELQIENRTWKNTAIENPYNKYINEKSYTPFDNWHPDDKASYKADENWNSPTYERAILTFNNISTSMVPVGETYFSIFEVGGVRIAEDTVYTYDIAKSKVKKAKVKKSKVSK